VSRFAAAHLIDMQLRWHIKVLSISLSRYRRCRSSTLANDSPPTETSTPRNPKTPWPRTKPGELDPETAALLTGIIEPLAISRPVDEFGREDTRPLDDRQGDALAELIHPATRVPDLPASGSERH
jgi:hypothetical protein